jgi:uncharacterized membrane protein (UPF0127 family)
MYRSELADGHGMLFVFDADANHEFWMKNTLIPLDMIFITVDGQIAGVRKNATPMSEVGISVGTPSRYVLEVPAGGRSGTASRWGTGWSSSACRRCGLDELVPPALDTAHE